MMRQREVTPRVAWYFIGLGAVVLAAALIRDWSTWPDFRTILGASMAAFGALEIVVGVYALRRARRGRDVQAG
ncbi:MULTISPECIES: hypothetical protein [Tsukamurella]|uniref:Uncharacterized protein n=2 Tax=Tsukamurella TaxID=2060 RepID=A0A5C5RZI0_9ACTN|nr:MULTISPECIES: hypothetical protein [Tsukamurella]NMD56712.1 hypothetical protein [Tsukamurella columbiensis]TWS27391.1 hypothetical protein FK530_18890 [Tsukamurella conjunctivitidis]